LILPKSTQICLNLITFAQISPQFCPNLITFAQILPKFRPNLTIFAQIKSILPKGKKILNDAAASPTPTTLLD